jgi:hypothetical protein
VNIWKVVAICLAIGLVASIGTRPASAAAQPTLPAGCGPNQPNMSAAIGSMKTAIRNLRASLASLDHAEKNKGGWRVTAINSVNGSIASVNTAIAQVTIGCDVAD